MFNKISKVIKSLHNFIKNVDNSNYITLCTFNNNFNYIIKCKQLKEININNIDLQLFNTFGCTLLYDSYMFIVKDFMNYNIDTELHCLTDGEDNMSVTSKEKVEYVLDNIKKEKNWNIIFYNPNNIDIKIKNIKNVSYDVNNIENIFNSLSI
tara:strand:- start:737 stop:1192 length:456 start_codon:yes stop_codon:yes gene_type:complete